MPNGVPCLRKRVLDKSGIRGTVKERRKEDGNVTDYESLIAQAEGLTAGVPHPIANMANVSALIYESAEDLNWAGFYLLEGDTLVLGPFQGRPACIEIPVSKGVCGAAVRENRSQLVPDVHAFPGHIACDCASRSELVVPLRRNGAVFGVLDLDSPTEGRFTEADRAGMERLCAAIESSL
ncbi:MAG: GAF domain-containing protein [Clostridia bacterium]|nr:GAF domain-containing protein [Clostridia bacterium]